MVSVITPVYNEEKVLHANASHFKSLAKRAELIFVDGKSSDKGMQIAKSYGKVLQTKKGRAAQMNRGARSAKGDILLFLHADATISPDTISSIERGVSDNGATGGCLTQQIFKDGRAYRFIEDFGNVRARIAKIFYGDQGIFVKKKAFFEMGGFPDVPVMEDVIFSKKMRGFGKTVILPDKISVSARRWKKRGVVRTAIFYSLLNILFWLGVPLKEIKSLYGDLR